MAKKPFKGLLATRTLGERIMPGDHPVCCGMTMTFFANGDDHFRFYSCVECHRMIKCNSTDFIQVSPAVTIPHPVRRVSCDLLPLR